MYVNTAVLSVSFARVTMWPLTKLDELNPFK